MLTVIEGPDGAGKTTLVQQLSGHGSVLHHGPLKDPFKTYLHDAALAPHQTVLDRLYPSEHVYGPVVRGKNLMDTARTRMLNRALLGRRAALVKCLPAYETAKAAWASRLGEEYVQAEATYDQIYEGYARLTVDLPTYHYDWERDDLVNLLTWLHRARPPVNRGPGAGWFAPGVTLLVGEQAAVDALYDLPFVHDKGCSPWLAEQLDQVGVSEQRLYWVNALDRLGRPRAADFLSDLQPGRVIALGEVAARWCQAAEVAYAQVPHPQYWKRFRAQERYPLLDLLQETRTDEQL